jgi:hypothetical protein
MPEDTPPPIPREFRRDFRNTDNVQEPPNQQIPARPAPVAKTTYESAPQIRDLRKEAVSRFVPTVVRKKQESAKGGGFGHLVEPEEMDRLEAEGYTRTDREIRKDPDPEDAAAKEAARLAEEEARFLRELEMQAADTADSPDGGGIGNGLADAEKETPKRHVQVEDVEDEDT